VLAPAVPPEKLAAPPATPLIFVRLGLAADQAFQGLPPELLPPLPPAPHTISALREP